MVKQLILVGGGGHCKSVIEAAESAGYSILGVLDMPEEVGKFFLLKSLELMMTFPFMLIKQSLSLLWALLRTLPSVSSYTTRLRRQEANWQQ